MIGDDSLKYQRNSVKIDILSHTEEIFDNSHLSEVFAVFFLVSIKVYLSSLKTRV